MENFTGWTVKYLDKGGESIEEDSFPTVESVLERGFDDVPLGQLPEVEDFVYGLYGVFGYEVLTITDGNGEIVYQANEPVENVEGIVIFTPKPILKATREQRSILECAEFNGLDVLEIICSTDPIYELAKRMVLDDYGGDRGQGFARNVLMAVGKSEDEAKATIHKIIQDQWPNR
jgi:hypothetical protein